MFKRKTKTLLCESTVNTFVFTYIDIYGICTLLLAQFLAWNICFTTLKNVFVYFILFFPYLFCMYVCMYNWIGLCFIIIFFFFSFTFYFCSFCNLQSKWESSIGIRRATFVKLYNQPGLFFFYYVNFFTFCRFFVITLHGHMCVDILISFNITLLANKKYADLIDYTRTSFVFILLVSDVFIVS